MICPPLFGLVVLFYGLWCSNQMLLYLSKWSPWVGFMLNRSANSKFSKDHTEKCLHFIFVCPFFLYLAISLRHISWQFIIHHDLCWKTASSLIYASKSSLAIPWHHQLNDILSNCQEAAKVPNNSIAKLSICGFLGVALAANGLSVRARVQKAPRFICCWFFLETCGFVTSATIHWAVLLYCLILSRVE